MTQNDHLAEVLKDAHEAATEAMKQWVLDHKELPFNCGFAWVNIDGTTPLARWCRKNESGQDRGYYGSKGYPRGWQFWAPGEYNGQDMDCQRAGAQAFSRVLAHRLGLAATVGSRLD